MIYSCASQPRSAPRGTALCRRRVRPARRKGAWCLGGGCCSLCVKRRPGGPSRGVPRQEHRALLRSPGLPTGPGPPAPDPGGGLSPELGQQSSFQGASVMGSAALPWPPGSWSLGGSGAVRETRVQIPSLPAMRLGTRVPLCAAQGDGGHTQHSSAHPVPVAPHLCRSTAISETANVP